MMFIWFAASVCSCFVIGDNSQHVMTFCRLPASPLACGAGCCGICSAGYCAVLCGTSQARQGVPGLGAQKEATCTGNESEGSQTPLPLWRSWLRSQLPRHTEVDMSLDSGACVGGLRQVAAVGGCPLGGDCPDPMAVAHSPRVLARIARSMLVAKGATRQGKLEGEVPT